MSPISGGKARAIPPTSQPKRLGVAPRLIKSKDTRAGLMRGVRLLQGHAHDGGDEGMTLMLAIEASQSNGTVFRLAFAAKFFFPLASLVAALTRLF